MIGGPFRRPPRENTVCGCQRVDVRPSIGLPTDGRDELIDHELTGKVAIVTGGSSGIGRATVELFVDEGARVVIADLDDEHGEELAKALGESAVFKRTDVADPEQVQQLVD